MARFRLVVAFHTIEVCEIGISSDARLRHQVAAGQSADKAAHSKEAPIPRMKGDERSFRSNVGLRFFQAGVFLDQLLLTKTGEGHG